MDINILSGWESVKPQGQYWVNQTHNDRVGAPEDQGEGELVRGGQGGAKPGTRVSHRVVGGLVAWCRNKGHLERLGWWLLR